MTTFDKMMETALLFSKALKEPSCARSAIHIFEGHKGTMRCVFCGGLEQEVFSKADSDHE